MKKIKTEFLILGAGIVGISLARHIKNKNKAATVTLLEKEPVAGKHASGRNSGVIHAGFYYSPDSLKARLTRMGNVKMHEFLVKKNIPFNNCGKVVVTKNNHEEELLIDLYNRGLSNDVPLELINRQRLHELEPLAQTFKNALWSPTTSVANPNQVLDALAQDFIDAGGKILYSKKVIDFSESSVSTKDEQIGFDHLLNCAGLYADKIAKQYGVGKQYVVLPFKGLYWYAPRLKNQFSRHIYPVPNPINPFLGTHLTVAESGQVKIGPTAILALSRENYRLTKGLKLNEVNEIVRYLPRFLSSKHHNALKLLISEIPKYSKTYLVNQARYLAPSIRSDDFNHKGEPGIRAQLFNINSKRLEMDFIIEQTKSTTHVLNAVSPGWTTSLSMAEHLYDTYFS